MRPPQATAARGIGTEHHGHHGTKGVPTMAQKRAGGAISILAASLLTACTSINALSLPEAKGKPDGSVQLMAIREGDEEDQDRISAILGPAYEDPTVKTTCLRKEPTVAGFAPLVGAVVLAGTSIAIREGASFIEGYVEKKKKRYRKRYAGRLNIPHMTVGDGEEDAVTCLVLRRTLQNDNKTASTLILALEVEPNADAFFLRPIYLNVPAFAASTTPLKGRDKIIKANIEVGIQFIRPEDGVKQTAVSQFNQRFVVGRVKEGEPVKFKPEDRSSYVPKPEGEPASLVIVVEETGRGIEELEAFSISENAKIVSGELGNALKSEFGL